MLAGAMPSACGRWGTRMQSELLAMLSSGADEAHWPQSWVAEPGRLSESDFRCEYACACMPSWAISNTSDSRRTIERRRFLNRTETSEAGQVSAEFAPATMAACQM